jgi:HEAT repeat protein/DNA-binding NarL/FixJ family response regulator
MIRILSLDDEPQMLDILSLILRRIGCEHLTTTDNYEAWALLHSMPIHLFTQDLMRPEIDGWQFLSWMKADAAVRDIPVIAITANVQPTSQARILETASIAAYLAKPFRAQELLAVVSNVIAQCAKRLPPGTVLLDDQLPRRPIMCSETPPDTAAFQDPDPMVRRTAYWCALRSQPAPTTELLLAALINGDADIRFMAAKALGHTDASEVVPQLLQVLKHPDWEVRWCAALALGYQEGQESVLPLIAALNDPHHVVRVWSALALGRIGDEQAINTLAATLKDEHPIVRQSAILALDWLHHLETIAVLTSALNDTNAIVRILATQALGRIEDGRVVEAMQVALDDSIADVRKIAAEALGRIKDDRAIGALLHALHDPVPAVSTNAARALIRIGGSSRLLLFEKLSDPDPQVRQIVISTLRYVQDNAVIPLLIEALSNSVPQVRSIAAQSLGNFHNRQAVVLAIPALVATLQDEDLNVAWAAATALRRLGYTAAQPGSEAPS